MYGGRWRGAYGACITSACDADNEVDTQIQCEERCAHSLLIPYIATELGGVVPSPGGHDCYCKRRTCLMRALVRSWIYLLLSY